jgi:hypothetical protein
MNSSDNLTMALNANEQLLDQYLRDVLGIQSDLVRSALRGQGLTTIDDFVSLSEDDIDDVCKIIRRPGGTIPNPAYLAAQLPPIVAPPIAPPVAPVAPVAPRPRGNLMYYHYQLVELLQAQWHLQPLSFRLHKLSPIRSYLLQYRIQALPFDIYMRKG